MLLTNATIDFEVVLETNDGIRAALVGLDTPKKTFLTIDSEGHRT